MFDHDLQNLLKDKFDTEDVVNKFDIEDNKFEEKFGISKAKFFKDGKIKINRFVPLLINTGHIEITIPFIRLKCPKCGDILKIEDTEEKTQKVVCKKCKSIFILIEKPDKSNSLFIPEEFKNIQFPSSIEKEAIKIIHIEKFIGRPLGISQICISDRSIDEANQNVIILISHKLDTFLSHFYLVKK